MLKRQRPATPPPSSLGDSPSFLPNSSIRPFPSQHRSKRQRTQPPPLDGALRGWLKPKSTGSCWESDDDEDWVEDPHTSPESPLPSSTVASQYKDANSLLHELHVLNQHRLLFVNPSRDQPLDPSSRIPLLTAHTHAPEPTVGHGLTSWTCGSPYHPAPPQLTCGELAGRSCCIESAEGKGLLEEVQCVRQRYEGANRLLGSLFLSRRCEVGGTTYSADCGPNR